MHLCMHVCVFMCACVFVCVHVCMFVCVPFKSVMVCFTKEKLPIVVPRGVFETAVRSQKSWEKDVWLLETKSSLNTYQFLSHCVPRV